MRSVNSNQTAWMHRLIWVFAGWTSLIVGFVMPWLIFLFSPQNICYGYRYSLEVPSQGTSNDMELWKKSVLFGWKMFLIWSCAFGISILFENRDWDIVNASAIHPSIPPAMRQSRFLHLNHWAESNQTCYMTFLHGKGVLEQQYFVHLSICYLGLSHSVEFNQTCYMTSPHGNGMREWVCLPVTLLATLAWGFWNGMPSTSHSSFLWNETPSAQVQNWTLTRFRRKS